jgi:HEAT repeat protein
MRYQIFAELWSMVMLSENQIYERVKILKDADDPRLRIRTRQELSETNQEFLVSILDKIIKNETDVEILAYTAELILESQDKEKVRRVLPLIRFVDPSLRRHVCGLLGNGRDEIAIDPLIETLQNDESADVRVAAAFALGKIGHRRSLPVLNWAKDHDFSPDFEGRTVSEEAILAINEVEKLNQKTESD